MRVRALALDYDGTIATAGVLDPQVRAALQEARSSGLLVVIVTGRMLDDLRAAAGGLDFADAIVAENGGVVAFPGGRSLVLGPAPPAEFVAGLRARGFHVEAGECVVAASASIAHDALQMLRDLELPLVLVFNGESLMVLPQSVNKAAGLREALALLGESPHNAIGIGDRENDHQLLEACGAGAAVAWGSEALKARAPIVIQGTGPIAVAEFVRRVARVPWISNGTRRTLPLGSAGTERGSIAVRGGNVLVVGDRGSGTSWITGLVCEGLILSRYMTCVIDGDGSHRALAALPRVERVDLPHPARTVASALEQPEHSIVVDLSSRPTEDRTGYVSELLTALATHRRRTGWPHWIVIDPLDEPAAAVATDAEAGGYVLASRGLAVLNTKAWTALDACVATRIANAADAALLAERLGVAGQPHWPALVSNLELGRAAVLFQDRGPAGAPSTVWLADRLTLVRPRQ